MLDNKYKELAADRKENGTGYNGSHVTSSYTEDFCSFLRFAIPIIGFILIFIIIFCMVSNIKYGIQQLFNPDYFALKEILDIIGSAVQ